MLAKVNSAAVLGLNAYIVIVEVDSTYGIGRHTIVGLPDTAIKESKERIESAIKNSGIGMSFFKRITVNLAPADLKKEGPSFDLPIAIALLATESIVSQEKLVDKVLFGELSLNGDIRSVKGVLSMVIDPSPPPPKGRNSTQFWLYSQRVMYPFLPQWLIVL